MRRRCCTRRWPAWMSACIVRRIGSAWPRRMPTSFCALRADLRSLAAGYFGALRRPSFASVVDAGGSPARGAGGVFAPQFFVLGSGDVSARRCGSGSFAIFGGISSRARGLELHAGALADHLVPRAVRTRSRPAVCDVHQSPAGERSSGFSRGLPSSFRKAGPTFPSWWWKAGGRRITWENCRSIFPAAEICTGWRTRPIPGIFTV